MLEHYIEMVEQRCAANIAVEIRALDMDRSETAPQIHTLSQTLGGGDANPCLEAYVGYLSCSINADTSAEVVNRYLNAAAAIDPSLRASLRDAVDSAYRQIDAAAVNQRQYFITAGIYRISLPNALHERLALMPLSPQSDESMYFHVYLVMMDDPKGLTGFRTALARSRSDVQITLELISALSNVAFFFKHETRDASAILTVLDPYRNDARRGKGVNGPGTGGAIQDTVRSLFKIFGRHVQP